MGGVEKETVLKWLFAIETEDDLIVICRLMNIFRRKGIKPLSLAMSRSPEKYGVIMMVELPESEAEHHFNFLRRTEGVRHVTYYRHNPDRPASFIYVNLETPSLELSRWSQLFPGSRLILASHGMALLEVSANFALSPAPEHEFLPFARVKTTRSGSGSEVPGTIQ